MSLENDTIITSIVETGFDPLSVDYVVNLRWYLEGVLLPVIGFLGVVGEFPKERCKRKFSFSF